MDQTTQVIIKISKNTRIRKTIDICVKIKMYDVFTNFRICDDNNILSMLLIVQITLQNNQSETL